MVDKPHKCIICGKGRKLKRAKFHKKCFNKKLAATLNDKETLIQLAKTISEPFRAFRRMVGFHNKYK